MKEDHPLHPSLSKLLYCIASAKCYDFISSLAASSAMVQLTLLPMHFNFSKITVSFILLTKSDIVKSCCHTYTSLHCNCPLFFPVWLFAE
jgi:hypothetical protein